MCSELTLILALSEFEVRLGRGMPIRLLFVSDVERSNDMPDYLETSNREGAQERET